jgi:heme/copper-type cytochrome/quinol oxidase subunit 2
LVVVLFVLFPLVIILFVLFLLVIVLLVLFLLVIVLFGPYKQYNNQAKKDKKNKQ